MTRASQHPFWPIAIAGFLALAIPAGMLIGLGSLGAVWNAGALVLGSFLALVTVGTLRGLQFEWRAMVRTTDVELHSGEEIAANTVAILAGTLCALAGTVELGLSPVVSASLVGIAAALVVPSVAIPAYCGAFVGMTAPDLFPTYWHALVAGGFASVVFVAAHPVFYGVGGKLGTTAFVGATLTVLASVGEFQSDPIPAETTVALVVVYSVIGAVLTFSIHARLPPGPVFASGVIGVVGGVVLPLAHGDAGTLAAVAVFAASFAGMTDPSRIPDERWMALSGLIVGLVVVYTMPYLGGSGGKLGTVAFGSSLAVHGLLGTLHVTRVRRRLETVPHRDVT